MKAFHLGMAGIVLLTGLALGGCGGGGAEVKATNTTMGQELMDIQGAYDKKIISQEQYERAKKDILRKYQ